MKTRALLWIGLAGLVAGLSVSCQPLEDPNSTTLDGTSWTLFAYRKTRPIEGTRITAEFLEGQVSGIAGCNHHFGSYSTAGSSIEFSEMGWTAMACLDPPGVMEQEQLIMDFFTNAERFELEESRLSIYRTDGEALTFDQVD